MVRPQLCREGCAGLGEQQVEYVSNEPLRQWSLTVSWAALVDLSDARKSRGMIIPLCSAVARSTVSSFEPLSTRNISKLK